MAVLQFFKDWHLVVCRVIGPGKQSGQNHSLAP